MCNKKVLWVIILWFAIIFGFVLEQETIIQKGGEVLLNVKPYDPRDLLRGDYINLTYDINTIPKERFRRTSDSYVYVLLKTDENNVAHYSSYTYKKPKSGLFIKGKTTGNFWNDKMGVKYGIESYFIKQKTGYEIEKRLARGGLARVRINKSGRAKIVELL